jgi:hypothetical protein
MPPFEAQSDYISDLFGDLFEMIPILCPPLSATAITDNSSCASYGFFIRVTFGPSLTLFLTRLGIVSVSR